MTHANERTRLAYLEALGVTVWRERSADPDAGDAASPSPDVPAETDPAAADWAPLRAAVAACTRCGLHKTRTQTVFGVGSEEADWMIVGEAPGAEEDRRGEPFVGRAGKLLDEMLRSLGLDRQTVFIANILKCRPPNNRDPSAEESAACRGYLDRQIELISPRIILAVGRVAAQLLLETDAPVGRMRGRLHATGAAEIPTVVTYHPAYLLRSPSQKRKVWDDLCMARAVMRRQSA